MKIQETRIQSDDQEKNQTLTSIPHRYASTLYTIVLNQQANDIESTKKKQNQL